MRHPVLFAVAVLLVVLLLLTGVVLLGTQLWALIAGARRSRGARRTAQPVDVALSERAAAVVDELAARVGVAAPPVRVVPLLGVPLRTDPGVCAGGLAVTRARPGRGCLRFGCGHQAQRPRAGQSRGTRVGSRDRHPIQTVQPLRLDGRLPEPGGRGDAVDHRDDVHRAPLGQPDSPRCRCHRTGLLRRPCCRMPARRGCSRPVRARPDR